MAEADALDLNDVQDVIVAATYFFRSLANVERRVRGRTDDALTQAAARRAMARYVAAYAKAVGVPEDSIKAWADPRPDDATWAETMRHMIGMLERN